jgi:hypothetical protein
MPVLMTILTLITIFLVIIHFAILYFWIFDWRQLVTPVGFIDGLDQLYWGSLSILHISSSIEARGLLMLVENYYLFQH